MWTTDVRVLKILHVLLVFNKLTVEHDSFELLVLTSLWSVQFLGVTKFRCLTQISCQVTVLQLKHNTY